MATPFRIDAQPVGGRITINGEDVTDRVAAAELRVGRYDPTVLTLHHLDGAGPIEGEGIVQVVEADDRDDADIICAFLEQIDPVQLEQDALMAQTAAGTLTGPMLQMLCAYARGVGL